MKMSVLFIFLLLAGTVEANSEYCYFNGQDVPCSKEWNMRIGPNGIDKKQTTSCIQRMREAMQETDLALSINRSLADRMSKRLQEKWDATMKDCVQGGMK